jgi:NAD(P)-dependent dehydrogenase (short-subunit alcohol dehydrogenase family)
MVTGCGQGVGAEVARVLVEQGANVIVNDYFAERAEEVARRVDGRALAFDVTDVDAVRAAFAEVGPVDVLVTNPSIPVEPVPHGSFKDSDPELWASRFVDLNLYGALNCTHTALQGMCDRGWGRIIIISTSELRRFPGGDRRLSGPDETGAIGLMSHVAHEVDGLGVTCNSLAVDASDIAWNEGRHDPGAAPGARGGIGCACAFLVSDGSEWITGQVIAVTGATDRLAHQQLVGG